MLAPPQVDVATADDLEALAALRTEQGWQRSEHLLRAIEAWDAGGRIFVIREAALNPDAPDSRAPVVTTSAVAAGPVGVIGTVIVREDYRRRGLGRVIMTTALDWLRARGVRTVWLDATVDGRPLYFRLGFVGVEESWFGHVQISAIHRDTLAARAGTMRGALRSPSALTSVQMLDIAAYGGDRLGFLAAFLRLPQHWLYLAEDAEGQPAGYMLVRCLEAPYAGIRLGPWVARDPAAAYALLDAVLDDEAPWRDTIPRAMMPGAELFVSLPGTNKQALHLFEAIGGKLVVDDLIMRLDFDQRHADASGTPVSRPAPSAHPEWLYGWIAPMVF